MFRVEWRVGLRRAGFWVSAPCCFDRYQNVVTGGLGQPAGLGNNGSIRIRPKSPRHFNRTPLLAAAENGHLEIARLLASGAQSQEQPKPTLRSLEPEWSQF